MSGDHNMHQKERSFLDDRRDDIIRMAREAGQLINTPFDEWCERFAAIVAAAEREACAKVCELKQHSEYDGYAECATAIRERGQA